MARIGSKASIIWDVVWIALSHAVAIFFAFQGDWLLGGLWQVIGLVWVYNLIVNVQTVYIMRNVESLKMIEHRILRGY